MLLSERSLSYYRAGIAGKGARVKTEPTRRVRRTPEQRREQIMKAAIRLFARQGFARTTTRQIAREAGVSEGTIYRYFTSKQDLLFAFVEPTAVGGIRAMLQEIPGSDDEFIRRFFLDRLQVAAKNRPVMKVVIGGALTDDTLARIFTEKVSGRVFPMVRSLIAERVASGKFRAVDPTIAAGALVGMFLTFALFLPTLLPGKIPRVPPEQLAEQLASLFLDGVRARPDEVAGTRKVANSIIHRKGAKGAKKFPAPAVGGR